MFWVLLQGAECFTAVIRLLWISLRERLLFVFEFQHPPYTLRTPKYRALSVCISWWKMDEWGYVVLHTVQYVRQCKQLPLWTPYLHSSRNLLESIFVCTSIWFREMIRSASYFYFPCFKRLICLSRRQFTLEDVLEDAGFSAADG